MKKFPVSLAGLGRATVTVALSAFLLHLVNLPLVVEALAAARLEWVVAACVVGFLDRLLMIGKWYPLLRVQTAAASLGVAARAYLASGVAHYVLPASIGADVVRAIVLGKGKGSVVEVGASIVAERVLGLMASGVMALAAVSLARAQGLPLGVIGPWALLAVGLGVSALVVPMSPWVTKWVRDLARGGSGGRWAGYLDRLGVAYGLYRRHPRRLLGVGLLTLVEQLFPVLWFWMGARALGIGLGLGPSVVAVSLTLFVMRLPISLGGVGVGEAAFVYLVGLYGVPPSDALALALLGRVVEVLANAGPAVFLWRDLIRLRGAPELRTGERV